MRKELQLIVIAFTATCASLAWGARKPKPPSQPVAQTTPAPAFERVDFTSEDGVKLAGRRFGAPGGVWVILSHQYNRDQTSWENFATHLAGVGYTVLTYDFRGYGDSGGKQDIAHIDRDLGAAVAYARANGATALALIGASMGGIATVPVAAATKPQAIVLLTVGPSFNGLVAGDDNLKAIAAPKLFVGARYDFAMEDTRRMAETAAEPKELIVSKGGGHGTDLFGAGDGDAIEQQITAFIQRTIPLP
ncbi:alpha/beta hydrolase [Chitiniphilus eburneus]|uniref:Alpha/beta hydrolase n=1 Tax=Chitiniphilus eburneus TaxID=2571148 RepID=A0A4U0Q5U1_9NEIS|nr:alpha/beta fold hydrolase [Chitiniphilus eburneus]TJZ71044.1 alpha/beta hydrolase [Chitiniphilus eburneus]